MAIGVQTIPLGRWGEALASIPGALDRVARLTLRMRAELMMAASKRIVPYDLAALQGSGAVYPAERVGSLVQVTLGYGGPAVKYAVYVHEGTGPAVGHGAYMPPASALEAWAVRHGFPPGSGFVVARAIGRRGTKARKYLERPVLEQAKNLPADLQAAAREELG